MDETVKYLRGLNNKLEVLKISGNKFNARGEKDYSKYIIAHIKQLKYLDYELITTNARNEAHDEHKEELNDRDADTDGDKADEGGAISQELREARIANTVNMFKNAIDNLPEDEKKVVLFTKFPDCFQTSEG